MSSNKKRPAKEAMKYGVAYKPIHRTYSNEDRRRVKVKDTISMDNWLVEHSGEDNINKETLNDARKLVEESFRKVQQVSRSEVVKPETDNFLALVNNFRTSKEAPRAYKTTDGSIPEPLFTGNTIPKSSATRQVREVKVVDRNKATQSVDGVVVPTNKGILPRIRYFLYSEQNIKAPDVLRLSHVPYIGDDPKQEDIFASRLEKLYIDGIHGNNIGRGGFIDDYMMWKLLEILNEKWKGEYRYICGVIFQMFPNKYSYEQLMSDKTLTALRKRFSPSSVKEPDLNGDARIQAVASSFCPLCFRFGCPSHKNVAESLPPLAAHEPKHSGTRCGGTCYHSVGDYTILPLPKLESTFLLDMFKVRVTAVDLDLCKLAKQMNMMCTSVGVPQLECRQWFRLLKSCPQEQSTSGGKTENNEIDGSSTDDYFSVPPTSSQIQLQRGRYKKFIKSLGKRGMNGKVDNTLPFEPCNHPGTTCQENSCDCYKRGAVCTKYCRCDIQCSIKFTGCTCTPGRCVSSTCACFLAQWECDPDTCLSCNCDVTHPQEAGDDGAAKPICRNMSLQLPLQKTVKVGISAVAGNGLFLVGPAKAGDLIGEYTGELISDGETERRGAVYDKYGCSYVFGLNEDRSIDACKVGNLLRFANNDSENPNCAAKIVVLNGEQRIGIYAKRDICDGEELFFDYQYGKDHQSEFVGISQNKKKPNGKNSSSAK